MWLLGRVLLQHGLLVLLGPQLASFYDDVFLSFEELDGVFELVGGVLKVFHGLLKQAQSLVTACQVVIQTHDQVRFSRLLLEVRLSQSHHTWTLGRSHMRTFDGGRHDVRGRFTG